MVEMSQVASGLCALLFLLLYHAILAQGCGGSLTGPARSISSPNFPQNYNNDDYCRWTIEVEEGKIINLIFGAFQSELGRDFVKVYEGDNLLGDYSGSTLPNHVNSSSNSLRIVFNSDSSNTHTGFLAVYYSTDPPCNSPGHPLNGAVTPTNGRRLPHGTSVQFTCRDGYALRGAETTSCTVSGTWSSATPICEEILCEQLPHPGNGQVSPRGKIRYGQSATVSCYDGYFLQGSAKMTCRGSSAIGRFDRELPTCEKIFCEYLRHPRNGQVKYTGFLPWKIPYGHNATFSCNDGYFLQGSANLNCRGNSAIGRYDREPPTCERCGGNLTDPKGVLMSPKYPNNYPKGVECEWRINVPSGKKLTLFFTTFHLEGNINCTQDYVKVYEGEKNKASLLDTYCGNNTPPAAISTGDTLIIIFKSDHSGTSHGFQAIYSVEGQPWILIATGTVLGAAFLASFILVVVLACRKTRHAPTTPVGVSLLAQSQAAVPNQYAAPEINPVPSCAEGDDNIAPRHTRYAATAHVGIHAQAHSQAEAQKQHIAHLPAGAEGGDDLAAWSGKMYENMEMSQYPQEPFDENIYTNDEPVYENA